MKTEKIKASIKTLLIERPALRDDNSMLAYAYYLKTCPINNIDSIGKFFGKLATKEIPTFDTISRLSRLLQMENENLRGSEWLKRQRKQKDVISNLGYGSRL